MVHWVGVGVAQPKGRQGSSGNGWADSLVELKEPEPRQRVRGVVGQPKCRQQIFYVCGFYEPQPPIFDIGNSSTPKLEFEQIRVVCGTYQHRLLLECDPFLSVRKYLPADRRNLNILIGASNEAGARAAPSSRSVKHSREAFWSFSRHLICHVKNWLAGSVVDAENHGPGPRKGLWEVQDMTWLSSAEGVDRLCIVTNDRNPVVGPAQRLQNVYLQSVHVLIFIDQYVVEGTG